MMSGYTNETDAHLSVYARVDIIAMCSVNHSAIKQGNACITSSSRPDGWLKQFKIWATPVAYFSRVPHLPGDRAPFESRPETVGWLR